MQISSILSDYDGTLCPTTSVRSEENVIQPPLNSKEDISFDTVTECRDFRCIKNSYLPIDDITLQHNSELLSQLAEEIASCFKEVSIEHKFTLTHKKTLAGITIDWRHIDDWKSFKVKSEPELRKAIIEKQSEFQQQDIPNNIHTQTYTTHPFIDIYAVKCDKGMAYNTVLSKVPITDSSTQKVMYIGDSENDNAAFRKADISIGVKSDERLNPKLDCKYTMKFDKLAFFLEKLHNDNFVFHGI